MTGATGYLGASLVPLLLARGQRVLALARAGSADRVPAGAEVTRARMTRALAAAVDSPPAGVAVVDVPGIRAA